MQQNIIREQKTKIRELEQNSCKVSLSRSEIRTFEIKSQENKYKGTQTDADTFDKIFELPQPKATPNDIITCMKKMCEFTGRILKF